MKHRGDTDITSSIHIFIIYSKTSMNSTALSMLDRKANDHSYSHRALFVSFTYLPIFEIREHMILPEYTVRENDNYFVMHSSSLHLHVRYFPVSPHLIRIFRSIDLEFYHPSCVLQLLVPLFIDSVKTSSEPQFNPGRVRLYSIENTHTCTFTCPFALCHYFVKSTHWGKSKVTILSRSSRINLRPQKQIIIITVIIINVKMVPRNNYYFMDIFVRFFLFGYLLLIFIIR